MYYSAGTYEAFAHPEKPQGCGQEIGYISSVPALQA